MTSDDCLHTPDAIAAGILLFGAKVCADCGRELPACTDYYTRRSTAGDLKTICKSCRAARARARYAADPDLRRRKSKAAVAWQKKKREEVRV
jgi:hypothetical protein